MTELLIHRIKVKQAEIKESLATGAVGDFNAYQRLVGRHMGLQECLQIIDDLLDEDKRGD